MALISQSIKNLKGGISQQPDILRYPDQGKEQINGWSSETQGLQKRPPMLFIKGLGSANHLGTKPYVHLINRDESEQYYAVFTGDNIKVFDLKGNEYSVRGNKAYANTTDPRRDLRMITIADYTFVVNRRTRVLDSGSRTNGGTFNDKHDALINVRGGQYGRTLRVDINGNNVATLTLPDGGTAADTPKTDAQYIADQLAAQMRTNLGSTWKVSVGSGYIWVESPGSINTIYTSDGYADQLISPVTHYVQSVSRLPLKAPNGYTVKVMGDASSTADQYYVKYDAINGVWKETVGWNVLTGLNNATMPWALVRAADGQFDFKQLDWTDRLAGDEDTNPNPSFVGGYINDVFFYRNRLGLLSGENVLLSQTAKYFNFFPPSVASLGDDDPIDVAVSNNRVSILKYAVPFTEELLLWSDEAQFVLNANGILSSKSIELNMTTQFDVQDGARPFGIGRNVYFPSPRASYTSINRYYAVQDVTAVKNAEDISAHVPSYVPNGVFNIHGSSTENFATVLTSGAPSKVFIYKFLYIDEQVRQQSWSHWDFGSNVTVYAASAIGSEIYILASNGANTFMGKISFTKNTVDLPGEPYRTYLDAKIRYTIPAGTYNDDTFSTKVDIFTAYKMNFMHGTIAAVEPDGRVTLFEEPDDGWPNKKLEFNGNMEGKVIYLGFLIPFKYTFSKFLIKKTADDGTTATEDIGRLQLRRAWVNYQDSGAFSIAVHNLSRTFSYEMAGARLGSADLIVGALNLGTGQFRFPITGNATTNEVTITAYNTTPLSIIGCGWEGNYLRRSSGI